MSVTKPRWPLYGLKLSHLGWSLAVFVLLSAGVTYNIDVERELLRQELRTEVTRKATTLVSQLESELNANIFLANGLIGHITADPNVHDGEINTALRTLYKFGRHLRNIGIAPGNRVSHVYPLEGNQAAIGLYYPDTPSQWPGVKRAIDSHATVLAGPVYLRQGGSGLISRTPVFLEDGSYWGIVSLVLTPSSLYAAAGLSPEADGIRMALRGRDGRGPEGEVFFGDPALFELDAIKLSMVVPGGSWQAAAYPVGGWEAGQEKLAILQTLGVGLAALLALAIHGYQRNRFTIEVSQKRLSSILETTPDGVILVDRHGVVREFNPAAEELFGYPAGEILGKAISQLLSQPDGQPGAMPEQEHAMLSPGVHQHTGRRRDGRTFPVEITVGKTVIGDQPFLVGVFRDISERKAMDEWLRQLATTDSLTGALNRRAFLEAAEKVFQVARRHGRPLSLLMIDADHFKAINDSYGHDAGDRVLTRLAEVARGTLRATDMFCRFGGEEFIALLPETAPDEAANMAQRLLTALRDVEVATSKGEHLRFTVSIGIAALSAEITGLASLIRSADAALYEAKNQGRDRWCSGAD